MGFIIGEDCEGRGCEGKGESVSFDGYLDSCSVGLIAGVDCEGMGCEAKGACVIFEGSFASCGGAGTGENPKGGGCEGE